MSAEIVISLMPIESIRPYEKNAKQHTDEQIKKIASSIEQFGWDQPIVVETDGTIIKGHGRRLAAIELGLQDVPVLVRNDLNKQQAQAARIADNRVALGDFDEDMLKQDLAELFMSNAGFELTDMGFDQGEIEILEDFTGSDELLDLSGQLSSDTKPEKSAESASESVSTDTPKGIDPSEYKSENLVVVECNDETSQEDIYEEMTGRGFKCRVLSL